MGKKSKGVVLLIGMVASLLGLVPSSWAEFRITPSIALREEYNDNIFLTATNTKDDFITSISPALHLGYTASILTLDLDYGLDFRLYAKNSDQNLTSISNTQRAKVDTTLSLYKDIFFIKVLDEYARVPIDQRNQTALNNYIVNMTDSNHLLVSPYVVYPLSGAIKARFGYSYGYQWYRREGNSFQDHDGFAGITVDITSNINASITYDYLIHRLTGPRVVASTEDIIVSDDYDRQMVSLAAAWTVNPKLSLSGSIGETWFDYKNGKKQNSPVWSALAKYQLTDRISLSAGYNSSYTNSVNSGTYKQEKVQGTITYGGKLPLSLSLFRTIDTYQDLDREDKSKGVSLSSTIPITPKMTGSLTGTYQNLEFTNPGTETADRYSFDAALNYAMRITTLTIGYTYNRNGSSVGSNDYTNNIVYIQARFTL